MTTATAQPDIRSRETRLVIWWGILHLLLLAATGVAFAIIVGEHPVIATIVTITVSLLCTVESFWIIAASRRGVVRRILSHWDQGYTTILFMGLFIMSSALNTCTILTWIQRGIMDGVFGGGGFTFSRLLILIPCTIPLILFSTRVGRLEKLRDDHCRNCGYPLQKESPRCPECGYRWPS